MSHVTNFLSCDMPYSATKLLLTLLLVVPSAPVFAGRPNGMNDGWYLSGSDSLYGIGIKQVDKIQGGGKFFDPRDLIP